MTAIAVQQAKETQTINVRDLVEGRFYVRTTDSVSELVESINQNGLLREPTVTPIQKGKYLILSGHRRIRAIKEIGWKTLPVHIVKGTKRELTINAVVENLISKTYNSIEEARSYQLCIKDLDLTTRDLEKSINRDYSTISRSIELLNLDDKVQEMVASGELTKSNAEELFTVDKPNQLRFAKAIANMTRDSAHAWLKLAHETPELAPKLIKAVVEGKLQPSFIETVIRISEGQDDTKLAADTVLAASKGDIDPIAVQKLAEVTPKKDMARVLRKHLDGELDVREIQDAGDRASLAKTAHHLVKDSFDKHAGPSESEKLLSTGGSLVGVGVPTGSTNELVLDSTGTEGVGSPRKIGSEQWYPVNDIMRPILRIIQANIGETAEVTFTRECSKCKALNRFRANLSNENIIVDLSKAKFALAQSDLEKLKKLFTEALAQLETFKVEEEHDELVQKAVAKAEIA